MYHYRPPLPVSDRVVWQIESTDPEFEDYKRHFGTLENATEKLLKDAKTFIEEIISVYPRQFHL